MKILRPEVKECVESSDNLNDLLDNVVKVLFNITDSEYLFILNNVTDDELKIFISSFGDVGKPSTFSERRRALNLRNQILAKFNK